MDAYKVYAEWLSDPFVKTEDKEYLKSIIEDKALVEELFCRDLSFGTAGMRGKIGVGTNRINIYQVAKATQAYANHLINTGVNEAGVAIAYDTRHKSKEFAETAARVLLGNNVPVYLFEGIRSVPELSFTVRYLNTAGGIVITASHNPKEYNGYKLYSKYGGQLVPDAMMPIIDEFSKMDSFRQIKMYDQDFKQHPLFTSLGNEVDEKYYEAILKLQRNPDIKKEDIKIVYSPLHGTGMYAVPEVLKRSGFTKVYVTAEQNCIDPDFSTVNVPNPENAEALDMSIKLADKHNADIVMATDPDCDRVGIAVKEDVGKYIILNGNQIGALLIDYLIHGDGNIPENAVVIQTIVTSNLGKNIAEKAGVEVREVLTGFKYIGEMMTRFEEDKKNTFLFGYEESYGFLSGNHAQDKDAVNACLLLAEMAAFYKTQNKTVYDRLTEIYEQFGYYFEYLYNITFEGIDGMAKMDNILSKIRNHPLREIDGEKVTVTDYLMDNTGLPKENVLKFNMESGSWVALRPSGTEPKFKIYFSCVDKSMQKSEEKCQRIKTEILTKLITNN